MSLIRGDLSIAVILLSVAITACNEKSDSDENKTVVVSLQLDESVLRNPDCFDAQGLSVASSYVFEFTEMGAAGVDDMDGTAPEPLLMADLTDPQAGIYHFQMELDSPGKYQYALTCDGAMDDPGSDDDVSFYYYQVILTGKLSDLSTGILPEGHLQTTLDCSGCHEASEDYELIDVNHSFVVGMCSDCHS